MKKINLKILVLTIILCLSLSFLVSADNSNRELIGSFELQNNRAININSKHYVPLEEVAEALNYNYDWDRKKTEIDGHLNYQDFETKSFLIAYGYLYLPLKSYEELFDLEIVTRGNRYYIYRNRPPYIEASSDLELVLQTDKTQYKRNEPIAVSLLLLNQSELTETLRFNSSKKYDLILKRYNREVWRLSDNMNYMQALTLEVLERNGYRLYTNLIEPYKDSYISRTEYTLEVEMITTNGMVMRDEVVIDIY